MVGNLLKSVPRLTYSSQYASGIPTHPLVPFPNGTKALSIRRASFRSSHLSGSNFNGSGKYSGSWCKTQELIDTTDPAGMKTPLNVAPPSGTSRGSLPGTPNDRLLKLAESSDDR